MACWFNCIWEGLCQYFVFIYRSSIFLFEYLIDNSTKMLKVGVRVMVFNATFNNISIILWQSVLLVEETRISGENHRSATSHWQTWSHKVVSSIPRLSGIQIRNVSGDRHWCIGSYKSNNHTIMTTTIPCWMWWSTRNQIKSYREFFFAL
jgi:hypothetical protein